jgi:hypothetical protein
VAKLLSTETALEMTATNRATARKSCTIPTTAAPAYPSTPKPTAAEQAELKKPAYLKADKEFKANEQAIHHETFVLLKEVINGK